MAISVIPEISCSSHFLEHQIASGAENLRMAAEVDEESAHSSLNPTLLDCIRHCPYLMFSTIVASFGGILFGFDTAALNGILIMPSFIMAMGGEHLSATGWADRSSWITSSLLLGAAFSSPFTAIVADSVGRKVCINVSSLIIFIGACLQTFAQSWVLMVIGRLIVGGGIGMLSTAVPLYLAEVSPQSIRGAISSLFELTVACGILIAFIVNWGFNGTSISLPFGDQSSNSSSNSNSDSNWRYILGIQAAMALCLSAMMIPLPESPRWLISIGNEDMARATLKRIRRCVVIGRRKTDAGEWLDVTNIDHECDEMLSDFDMNRRKETAWYDFSVLLQPAMLLRTGIAISIKVLQQLTGINSIMYYSSIIFSSIGIDPDTTTVVTGLVNVTATFLSILLIDRWGRRPLLIWGSVGMCVSSLGVGGIVLSTDASEPVAATFIAILICFFIVNFAYSYGPIAWLYPAEIFPMHARAKGQ